MANPSASFNLDGQPVLPLANLLGQNTREIIPLAIGAKIKSFKIDETNTEATADIDLLDLDSCPNNLDEITIASYIIVPSAGDPSTVKRFWWSWLLSTTKKLSMLALMILLQSSTQASSLFERAKIYTDLDSHVATTIPPSGRAYLEDSQASPFNRAIEEARQVDTNSVFYAQAQGDINRWSETILDIAKGRAGAGNYAGAIAAAQLVPQDHNTNQLIAKEASQIMADWQIKAMKQDVNQIYLAQAKTIINPTQASSYSRAIGILQQIPSEAKEHQEAQGLISQWNEQIYLIVQHRVARGNFKQAVEAAVLLSQDSAYYQLAQDSINTSIKSLYRAVN